MGTLNVAAHLCNSLTIHCPEHASRLKWKVLSMKIMPILQILEHMPSLDYKWVSYTTRVWAYCTIQSTLNRSGASDIDRHL